ncbi:MAG: regulator of sirC expression with transglutaminase-like and TPR domain [Gammaproteobacteria bacterium]|jgi:regulator of sirC expression with transglutaminase-like and TPR domain
MNPLVSQYFNNIVIGPDENINLAEAVLTIALNDYPQLDIASYLLILDGMAADIQAGLAVDTPAELVISSINDYLFEEKGFSGNWRNFNDPRNSFLNEVLDRKLGIPVSLSLVYIEIGKRLDLSMHGVSFPGHFLVKYKSEQKRFIIDPFSGGIILEEADLLERLEHFASDRNKQWNLTKLLQSAANTEILVRMLRNLKSIYLKVDDYHRALNVTSLQLILEPESLDGLRDRACIFEQLDCYRAASDDFQRYLELNPQASDSISIKSRLSELRQSINRLH